MKGQVLAHLAWPAVLLLTGCGSVQEVIMESARASAKEAVEEAVDEAIDDLTDEFLDLDGLLDLDEEDEMPEE